jgi:hypothetical protein
VFAELTPEQVDALGLIARTVADLVDATCAGRDDCGEDAGG